jgi:hypothetical protein
MKKIEYGDILRKAWNITWNNKLFWWLGFFVAIGSGFNGYSGNSQDLDSAPGPITDFAQNHLFLFVAVIFVIAVIGIAIYVFSVISRAALIKAVNDPVVYSKSKVTAMIATGRSFFWRLILLDLLFGLAVLALIIALAVPVILLFYLKSYILGSFVVLCALVILIPVLFFAHFMKKYASFYVVISDMKLRTAIELSYDLFSKTLKESVIMGLLSVGVSILISSAFLAIILSVGCVFFLIGFLLNLAIGTTGIIIAACLGIALVVVLLGIISGAYQTFFHALWVCFYKEIAAIKSDNEEEMVAEETLLQHAGNPEAVV